MAEQPPPRSDHTSRHSTQESYEQFQAERLNAATLAHSEAAAAEPVPAVQRSDPSDIVAEGTSEGAAADHSLPHKWSFFFDDCDRAPAAASSSAATLSPNSAAVAAATA